MEQKILAVGNSFTQDSFFYLHDLAEAAGHHLKTVNLYIGGCSLERHGNNIAEDKKDYLYELNGISTGKYVSVREALEEGGWNYILTQQASHDSGIMESYFPYLTQMLDYFHEKCPEAQCLLQKTWAYELDSNHGAFERYHHSQQEMYKSLDRCYKEAAERTNTPLIPSADVIQAVRGREPFRYEMGELSLCRDGFHMDMIYGRYLLAATILTFLYGEDIRKNPFIPEGADQKILAVIQEEIVKRLL